MPNSLLKNISLVLYYSDLLRIVSENISMPDALITADNISLNHNGKNILDDVSLRLHPGEFITLIGPNGAGKSSLIKVLLGIIKQDSSQVSHSNHVRVG